MERVTLRSLGGSSGPQQERPGDVETAVTGAGRQRDEPLAEPRAGRSHPRRSRTPRRPAPPTPAPPRSRWSKPDAGLRLSG